MSAHKSLARAESNLRTLGDMLLENPDDEIIEARYELALRTYSMLARKVQAESEAESVAVTVESVNESAVQYGYRKIRENWLRELAK